MSIDRQWRCDAVIYQVHVKSFADADTIGDLDGVTEHVYALYAQTACRSRG